jgi:hypothetical protein
MLMIERVYDPGMLVMEVLQQRLERDLAAVCGHLDVLHERLVTLTPEMLEAGAWENTGRHTPQHWLAWQTP